MLEDENDIDIDEIKKGFEMFDVDNTGYISPSELLETFDAMNLKSKNPFIYNIISSLSKSKKYHSQISLDELISYIDSKLNSNTKKGINLIFDSLCEPNNNHISLSSLPHYARDSDDIITEKELRTLLQKAEMNGEEIEFDEFLKILSEGKNLEDDADENDILSDKENIDENVKKNGGNIKELNEIKNNKNNLYENKYNINSHNSINSSNSNTNNNSTNKIYRKKPSNKISQNNDNNNKNISSKIIRNEKIINNKKKDDDEIININISEEIKKSESQSIANKYKNRYNKKPLESPKKESIEKEEEDSNENSNEENEETENGMESVNKSINKYLEKKIESESIKNKRIPKQETSEEKSQESKKNNLYNNKPQKKG